MQRHAEHLRKPDVQQQRNAAGQRAEDQRVGHDAARKLSDPDLLTAPGFQGDHGQHVIPGHAYGDTHGDNPEVFGPAEGRGDRQGEQYRVGPEPGLNHGGLPGPGFFKAGDEKHQQDEHRRDGGKEEPYNTDPVAVQRRARVHDVFKHKQREQHAEDETAHDGGG